MRIKTRGLKTAAVTVVAASLLVAAAGCSKSSKAPAASANGSPAAEAPTTLRLGYFANVTHATAIVGVENGIFAKALGANTLKTSTFSSGTAASEAILSGSIDATFIGPNPAINAYVKTKAIRIIAGATSGGAALVVKSSINAAADLKGKKIASPQLGNTQDVALRYWLQSQGLKTDTSGGGDVHIVPQENAQTLDSFKSGAIDGAWVPEPWATRLVQEGDGKVLVDEASLWPGGKFVTTQLIVAEKFLTAHPDAVNRLLSGLIEANDFVNANASQAQTIVNDGIKKITGKQLKDGVITTAWKNLTFTVDPISASLQTSADHAVAVGVLKKPDLTGIYDLAPLNALLKAAGKPEVQ